MKAALKAGKDRLEDGMGESMLHNHHIRNESFFDGRPRAGAVPLPLTRPIFWGIRIYPWDI
jgi:hypothetical protein